MFCSDDIGAGGNFIGNGAGRQLGTTGRGGFLSGTIKICPAAKGGVPLFKNRRRGRQRHFGRQRNTSHCPKALVFGGENRPIEGQSFAKNTDRKALPRPRTQSAQPCSPNEPERTRNVGINQPGFR